MEKLIPNLYPIESHALSKCDIVTKESYMSLLAAIAYEDRVLSSCEERYLKALCNGIKELEYKSIISGIDSIGDKLEESLKIIYQQNLGLWLFIDALILCRLDSVFSEKESTLLGNLADSLKLSRKEVITCLKLATVILSQDEKLLLEMITEVPEGFPFYAMHEAYNSQWFEAKFSFTEDLANGIELKGKYLIQKPVTLAGEHDLSDMDLVFSAGGNLTIEKGAKIKISKSSFRQTEITCAENSTLTLNSCSLSGGKGFYADKESSIEIKHSSFENVGITSVKASSILLENVMFKNLKEKRAMSLSNCMNVIIRSSKFISCGYDLQSTEIEEGGAILMMDCAILIDTCLFEDCTASSDGGALSFWKTLYGVKDSKFIKCKSGLNGGAMVVHDTFKCEKNDSYPCSKLLNDGSWGAGWPICIDTEFMSCSSADFGGAVMAYMKGLRFNKCLFEKCKAPNKGGGVSVKGSARQGSYSRFFDCRFVENMAIDGNGLWMELFDVCSDERQDIFTTTFHKCKTNMDSEVNCNPSYYSDKLFSRNTFTT